MILYGEEQSGREIHMGFAARFPFLHLILCHVRVRESDGRGDAFFQTRPCKKRFILLSYTLLFRRTLFEP